jgi:hypothetical protein
VTLLLVVGPVGGGLRRGSCGGVVVGGGRRGMVTFGAWWPVLWVEKAVVGLLRSAGSLPTSWWAATWTAAAC